MRRSETEPKTESDNGSLCPVPSFPVGLHRSFALAPSFEFSDCTLGERRIAMQIVGVEDRAHVAQAVPGDGGDLGLGASDNRKARDRCAA
jgi:hypothetical protein